MKIHNLTLEGYKTFATRAEYSFEDGIILLSGNNAAGKTTVFSALRLLITNQNDDTLENCINWNGATSFLLESEFSHEGTNFKTSLQCTKKGKSIVSDRKLWINDNLAEEGSENVVNRLAEYFDPKITDVALFSLQGKNQIVECDDATRREVLKKIYDISFDKEIDELEVDAKKIDANIQESIKKIYALENKDYHIEPIAPLPMTAEEFAEKEKELQNIDKQLQDLGKSTELIQTYNALKTGLPHFEEALTSFKNDLNKSAEAIVQKSNLIKSLENNLTTLPALLEETYSKEADELHAQFIEKENQLNEIVLERFSKDFPQEEELTNSLMELATLKAENTQLQNKMDKVAKGLCSECGRPYESTEKEAIQESLNKTSNTIQEKTTRIDEIRKAKSSHVLKVKDLEEKKEKKSVLTSQIVSLQNQIDALDKRKESSLQLKTQELKNEIEKCKTAISVEATVQESLEKRIQDLTLTIETDSKRILEISTSLGDISAIEEKTSSLQAKKELLTSSITSYSKEVVKKQALEESNKKKEDEKIKDKETLKTFIAEREKFEEDKLYYKEVKNILEKELPNHIIAQSVEGIEDAMNSFIDFIFYKPLNVKLEQVKQSIRLEYGSKDKKIPSKSASGAEKALIQLSFINAFNQELDLKCVCLDEIDAAISDENSETLFESLGTMKDIYSQVFIITHNKNMIDYLVANYNAEVIQL